MKKQTGLNSAMQEAILLAKEEKQIYSADLLNEIKPLLDEYFIGNFDFDGKNLNLHFLNGQNFRITAEEAL